MKTKIFSLLTLSVISLNNLYADSLNEPKKKLFTGFYTGLNLGYDGIFTNSQSDYSWIKRNAFNVGGSIGFGYQFANNLYTALEFNIAHRTGSSTLTDEETEQQIKLYAPLNMALVGKLGYVFQDVNLVYGLFGYDTLMTSVSNSIANTGYTSFLHGLRVGAGYERILFSNDVISVSGNAELYYKEYFKDRVESVKNIEDMQSGDSTKISGLNGLTFKTGINIRF